MLIRGGLIHTMTQRGSFTGDILIREGKIARVDVHIDPSEEECVLDAQGMTILPGLIDVLIRDRGEQECDILSGDHASGVTMGLVWPEGERACTLLTSKRAETSRIFAIHPEQYSDAKLHDRFLDLANGGMRIACCIRDVKQCRRVLQVVHAAGVKAILAHLSGCEEMLEAVAISGCEVIIGVNSSRIGSPWRMVDRLDRLGVTVAVTCSHPASRLRHLPLCAALCVREGMDRERALCTVTTAPAAILRLSDAGCIAAGSRADLAIYDGDPLLLATSHVMTIAGGKIRH